MNIEEVGARFSVSTNRVEQWFTLMGLKTPESFTMRHFVLADICREALLNNPLVSEEEIIRYCLPFMQISGVKPVDPSTHPLGGEIFEGEIIEEPSAKAPVSPLKLVVEAAKAIRGDMVSTAFYELNRQFFLLT